MEIAKKIFSLFLCLQVIACSTMVSIRSKPDGAKVYINNEYKGKTPLTVKLSNLAWKQYGLKLKKEGYEPVLTELKKGAKAGPIIAGIFLIIPLLWCYGPKDRHHYHLDEKSKEGAWIINDSEKKVVINGRVIEKGMNEIAPGPVSMIHGDESVVFDLESERVYLIKEKDRLSE